MNYQPVPQDGWHSQDTITFDLPVQETSTTCDVRAMVRALNDYEYEYLAMRIEHICDGNLVHADTVKLHLFNNRGEQQSTPFLYTNKSEQTKPITLTAGTSNQIRVMHIMRLDPIVGISSIGIECER